MIITLRCRIIGLDQNLDYDSLDFFSVAISVSSVIIIMKIFNNVSVVVMAVMAKIHELVESRYKVLFVKIIYFYIREPFRWRFSRLRLK